jgi:hypothetical protein
LDFLQEQVDCFALVGLDLLYLGQERVDGGWRLHFHEVLLALVQQILELAFRFLARFHLIGVRQIKWRLLSIEIDELGDSNVSEPVHDIPDTVLVGRQLI